MAIHEGKITLVRVRRLWYGQYGFPDIALSCKREILELRGLPVFDDTSRELWVRGPDRHWYVIFPDRVEALDWDFFGVRASRHFGQQTLKVG